jgi:hypothetical protein
MELAKCSVILAVITRWGTCAPLFREFIQKQTNVVKSIPCENLCNDALDLPLLKSLWENIMQDCCQETSKQTKKLCLENIVKLYLRIRSFSYAKDYISNFKMQQKSMKRT